MGFRTLATPLCLPRGAQGTDHAPKPANGPQGTGHGHTANRRTQKTSHAPTAAKQGPGDRPRLHGSQTGCRTLATPPQQPDGAHWNGNIPTAARQGPGDRPLPHSCETGLKRPATPPQNLGLATPALQPDGAQNTGHAPRAAKQNPGNWPRLTVPRQIPEDGPRPHGGQTGPRIPAMP